MHARAIALLCLAAPAPAFGSVVLRTRDGAMVHWENKTIRVTVDATAASRQLPEAEVQQALDGARATWNRVPEMRARFVPLTTGTRSEVKVRFCRARWKGKPGLLAHTEFVADPRTGVITSAVIEVNECDYRFLGPDVVADGRFDLQAALCHELGHVLGLGHSEDPGAIMFTATGRTGQRRLTLDDRKGLATLFGLPAPTEAALPVKPTDAGPALQPTARGHTAPAGVLAAVRLDGGKGAAMIYTCEPTILPAIAVAEPERKSKRKSSRARR